MHTISIDDETYVALKEKADRRGQTMGTIVREVVVEGKQELSELPAISPLITERLRRLELLKPFMRDVGPGIDCSRDTLYP